MDVLEEKSDTSSVQYLNTLLTTKENIKFNFFHFGALIQNEKISNEANLHDIVTSIIQLLKKCDKNFQMCSDLAHCFCICVTLHPRGTSVLFDILQKKKLNIYSNCAQDLDHLIEDNYCVLVIGVLKFFLTQKCRFQPNQCKILHSTLVALVAKKLLDSNNVNILLCIVETWLSIVSEMEVGEEMLGNVYTSVFSVAIIYWNIDIAEFRNRVEKIFFRCLCLNYEKDGERKRNATVLNVIVNMKTLRTVAFDMLWSLPFKYYAYAAALKFINKIYYLPQFLKHIRDDLRSGFAASLRNKRVISAETELFKFCTNSLPFDVWKEIFHPFTETILSSSNVIVANNFSRYWLPTIIRNFPQYAVEIFDRIPKQSNGRNVVQSRVLFALFKVCHIRKIKLASAENGDQLAKYLQTFFFDSEDSLGELFALLCNLCDQSTLHSPQELQTILILLRNNARTSSTILRQNLFSSFARFVLRLICSNVKVIRNDENAEEKLSHVLHFLLDLNEFFIDGIEPGSSYQRKLISLTLYKIFMTYAIRDCGGQIRKNNLKDTGKFVNFAKARGSWQFNSSRNSSLLIQCLLDPCEEIQNLSFTLLRTFFSDGVLNNSNHKLFSNVSELLNDSLFYKRNSGVAVALTAICLSYKCGNAALIEHMGLGNDFMPGFIDMFLNVLASQVEVLQEDILNSAIHHPLDSTIKSLIFLMTNDSSPEYHIVTESHIEKLISLLEIIVPHLLKALFIDKFSDYAPSFEESDNALETIIRNSSVAGELNVRDFNQDEFQMKPVNQILLNFIWISLKVCSELESYLISSRFHIMSEAHLIRCSDLVIQKLKLCRHKGVIEAAGISLSNIVKTLTENNSCENWLESIIGEIIYLIEHKTSATVSRKSAGLSLLVQNIVGNDRRTNKPLLTFCCTEFRRILNVDFDNINQTVLKELPQTHVLHFFKVLTADARNSEELSVFFEEIALVCLKALKAPIWIIRNAALQLFGAIVPKMVGQKNSQNDFGVRRSFEEVFLRMPALLHYIVSTFEMSAVTLMEKQTQDSDLVPLLIILVNIQVSTVRLMDGDLFSKLCRLRERLKYLLSSQLHFVRELASKSFVSLYCESEISIFKTIVEDVIEYVNGVESTKVLNENHLHGYLLVLKQAFSLYANSPNFQKQVVSQNSVLPFNPSIRRISLKSAALLYELEIISCSDVDPLLILNHMTKILDDVPRQKHLLLGYDEWSYVLFQKIFKYCHEYAFIEFASYCLNSSHSIIKNNFLKILAAFTENASIALFDLLTSSLKQSLLNFHEVDRTSTMELFNAIIKISLSCNTSIDLNTYRELFRNLIRMDHYEYEATNLLVLSLFTPVSVPDYLMHELLQEIFELLNPSKSNRDIRFNSANALLSLVNKLDEPIVLSLIWLSIIEVIQDEEMEIRIIGCECYKRLRKLSEYSSNPEIVLNELFNFKIMQTVLPVHAAVTILWDIVALKKFDIYAHDEVANPFEQGVFNNVYKETCRTASLAGKTLVNIFKLNFSTILEIDEFVSTVIHYYEWFIHKVLQNAETLFQNLVLSTENYKVVLKCYYLLLIFIELHKRLLFSLPLIQFNSNNLNQRAEKLCCDLRENVLMCGCVS